MPTTLRTSPARWPERLPLAAAVLALLLLAVNAVHRPASLHGDGTSLLLQDIALLFAYIAAIMWCGHKTSAALHLALRTGTCAGVVLGAVLIANHATELLDPVRSFAVVIAPVLVALALFGATGSIAAERTGSVPLGLLAGAWSAMVGVLLLLCAGFALTLTMEARVDLWLHEAFAASGMTDAGGFAVRNTFEAASESLVRMPVAASFLALLGAQAALWIRRWSRGPVLVAACLVPLMALGGAACLWHANSVARDARPPFVLAGILCAGVALAAGFPVLSAARLRLGNKGPSGTLRPSTLS